MKHLVIGLVVLVSCVGVSFAADRGAPADLVVTNARIWTGDGERPAAEALAVRDGVFVVVGTNDDVRALVGDATRVIDAQGKRVTPGIIDAHVHLVEAADAMESAELRAATSREDLLRIVREYAASHPDEAWIVARGWSAESWPDPTAPTPQEIDRATGGRPALLFRMDGHSLIAGAAALRAAKITRTGPKDPPGGKIGRRMNGTPTGAIYDGAMGLFDDLIPVESARTIAGRVEKAAARANSFGVTQIGAIESSWNVRDVFVKLDERGKLTLRIAATISEEHRNAKEWKRTLNWIVRNRRPSKLVRIIGIKGYMDGSLGSRTAFMSEPYLDNPPESSENAGLLRALASNGELHQLVMEAVKLGLQPALHAIGDRANHIALDWYAELLPSTRAEIRPRIEHAQHLLPEDVERFGELGVVASMQPLHKADDGRYAERRIGAARCRTSYAFRSLLDSGAVLAFGSDWPAVSVNPWLGVWAAASGKTIDGKTFVPEQSITVEEALRAYTTGAAYALHSEDTTGMIREGMRADFVVLDRDPLGIGVEEIRKVAPTMTVVDGRVVYP